MQELLPGKWVQPGYSLMCDINWTCCDMTMKKLFVLLFVLCFCFYVDAQDKQLVEAVLKTMEKGREFRKPYIIPVDFKFKAKDFEKVTDKLNKKLQQEYGMFMMEYHDNDRGLIDTIGFMPVNDLPLLAFEMLNPWNTPASQLKNKGKLWLDVIIGDGYIEMLCEEYWQYGFKYNRRFMYPYEGAFWTGTVEDGCLHGEGVGFVYEIDESQDKPVIFYYCVNGRFYHGYPQGEIKERRFTSSDLGWFYYKRGRDAQGGALYQLTAQQQADGDLLLTNSNYSAIVNREGKGHFSRQMVDEYYWAKNHKLEYGGRNGRGVLDFTGDKILEFSMKDLLVDNDLKSSNVIIAQWCVERLLGKLKKNEFENNKVDEVFKVAKKYPGINNVVPVKLDAAGSKTVEVKDIFLQKAKEWSKMLDFYDIFGDFGDLTKDEITEVETYSILWGGPDFLEKNYRRYFPNGKYSNLNKAEAWAQAYIDNAKAMLKRNDKSLLEDFSLNRDHKLLNEKKIPVLSQDIAGCVTRGNWGLAKTQYVFWKDGNSGNDDKIFNWLEDQKPVQLEEAKRYRKLMDCIAMAARVNSELIGRVKNIEEYFTGIDKSDFFKMMEDGYYIAKDLAQKYPEMKPACEAAAEFIAVRTDQIDDAYQSRLSHWQGVRSNRVRAMRQEQCEKCKINGSQTTFPSGWEEEWSFLFFGEPAQSKEKGKIVLYNGISIDWRYIEKDGKIKVKTSGYDDNIYDSVNEMVNGVIERCKKQYCN